MKHMKNLLIIALAVMLGFLAVTFVGGQPALAETETAETTETKGVTYRSGATGHVFVEPDIAYLTVGANNENEKASEAMAEVNRLMEAVLQAVKDAGVEDKDIQTANISIDVNYDYSGQRPVLTGYLARNTVTLTIRDLDKVAEILDATIAAGANDVGSLSFDKEDKSADYDEALKIAVERATEKVNVLHAASGLEGTLKPVRFDESGVQPYPMPSARVEMAADAAGVSVIPGAIEVVAQVTVEFALAD